jgi:predicted DNA-binding protein
MLSIRLKSTTQRSLERLARETGKTKSRLAAEWIEQNIEELEDRCRAELRMARRGKTYSSAQVRRKLGLKKQI